MDELNLQITMLGRLSLRYQGAVVGDGIGHSKKVWLLLAYLICNRGRAVSKEELAGVLWPPQRGEKRPANLANSMKTSFFRVRACLDGLEPGAGHRLVQTRENGYIWAPDVPVALDIEEFQALCAAGGSSQPDNWLQAAEMFDEGFLPKLREYPWAAETARKLAGQFAAAVSAALPLLEEQGRWQDMVRLCQTALAHDPLNESLYCRQMSALINLGENRAAAQVYEDMNQFFLAQSGGLPGEEAQSIYRRATHDMGGGSVPSAAILDQLAEEPADGAFICDYDVFRALYRLQVRDSVRSGEETSLAVVTVAPKHGGQLNRRSLELVMANLLRLIPSSLRQGDAVARCSASQYVLLLPRASFQNSREVCRRITRAFCRLYPHSPAMLQVTVCPLQPGEHLPPAMEGTP